MSVKSPPEASVRMSSMTLSLLAMYAPYVLPPAVNVMLFAGAIAGVVVAIGADVETVFAGVGVTVCVVSTDKVAAGAAGGSGRIPPVLRPMTIAARRDALTTKVR